MKKSRFFAGVFFLLISVGILSVCLAFSGLLPWDLPLPSFKNETAGASAEAFIADEMQFVREKTLPKDMHGVWLDLEQDIGEYEDPSEITNSIINDFDYYKNISADTIFIKPDISGIYKKVKNADGTSLDLLKYVLDLADKDGYYKIIVLDDSYNGAPNIFNFNELKNYLNDYSFDAVLLSSDLSYGSEKLTELCSFFKEQLSVEFPDIPLGCELHSDPAAKYADEYTFSVLNQALIDFAYIEASGAMTSKTLPFSTVFSWWNSIAGLYTDITFYCEHRMDLVMTNETDWSDYAEISSQIKYLFECEHFFGSCLYRTRSILDRAGSVQRLSALVYDGTGTPFRIASAEIDEENNELIVKGSSQQNYKLLLNHGVENYTGGGFTVNVPLEPGNNHIELTSRGKTHAIDIYENSEFIKDYYPKESMNLSRIDVLEPYIICKSGSAVTLYLDGEPHTMKAELSGGSDQVPAGYTKYTCRLTFFGCSDFHYDLGNLIMICKNGSESDAVYCGNVTLLKSYSSPVKQTFYDKIYENEFSGQTDGGAVVSSKTAGKASPFIDNGLGTALLCRIKNISAETLSDVTAHDTYDPSRSDLTTGMIDYVDAITIDQYGCLRYELACGIGIAASDAQLIHNGYRLPENNLSVLSVDDSAANSTDVLFSTDWFVPMNLTLAPLEYKMGHSDYEYNVEAFTAEYVDVRFYHTKEITGLDKLIFDRASCFSSCDWMGGDGTGDLVLRFHLKQKGQFYGYTISETREGNILLSFKKRSDSSLNGKVIMIDPGHGGLYMTGTAVLDNSVAEKDVTLKLAMIAKKVLEEKGATVLMTRTMDTAMDLDPRKELCMTQKPDIFFSIHCDGVDNKSMSGTHTMYYKPYSQPLAFCIHRSLVSTYQSTVYTTDDENYAGIDKKIAYYPYLVTRMDTCPSVLIETGYMSNDTEGKLLIDENIQNSLGNAIAKGVEDYFNGFY